MMGAKALAVLITIQAPALAQQIDVSREGRTVVEVVLWSESITSIDKVAKWAREKTKRDYSGDMFLQVAAFSSKEAADIYLASRSLPQNPSSVLLDQAKAVRSSKISAAMLFASKNGTVVIFNNAGTKNKRLILRGNDPTIIYDNGLKVTIFHISIHSKVPAFDRLGNRLDILVYFDGKHADSSFERITQKIMTGLGSRWGTVTFKRRDEGINHIVSPVWEFWNYFSNIPVEAYPQLRVCEWIEGRVFCPNIFVE